MSVASLRVGVTGTELAAETLVPSDRMREAALEGEVTQIHRGRRYADPGDRFEIDGVAFEVVGIETRTLGDLTDADARAEGLPDLDAYERLLGRTHDGFEWDDDNEVVRHRFERRDGDGDGDEASGRP
jgi:hypothetical protein